MWRSVLCLLNRCKIEVALLAFALFISFALRLVGVFEKSTMTFDESISYLAATGHQAEMAQISDGDTISEPVGVWTTAAEWKRLIRPEKAFLFRQIGDGLAHHDVHPPLYFWILHLWLLFANTAVWSGPLLNVLLAIPTTIVVFLFGVYILRTTKRASLATAIWALSPAVIASSWFARMYELVPLFAVSLVWCVAKLSDPSVRVNAKGLLLLAVVVLGGVLTHYLLLFCLILPAAFLTILRLIGTERLRMALVLIAIGFGIGLSWYVHPNFYLSFLNQQHQIKDYFTLSAFGERLDYLTYAAIRFFLPDSFLRAIPSSAIYYALSIPYTALIYYVTTSRSFVKRRIFHMLRGGPDGRGFIVIFFLAATASIISALYLSFILAVQQVWEYKTSMMWPFIAISIVSLCELPSLAQYQKRATLLAYLLCSLMSLSSVATTLDFVTASKVPKDMMVSLVEARNVIIDNRQRGIILPLVWHIPDDTNVFVGMPQELLQLADAWVPQVQEGTVFVHNSFLHDKDYMPEIANLVYPKLATNGYRVTELKDIWGGYTFYLVQ